MNNANIERANIAKNLFWDKKKQRQSLSAGWGETYISLKMFESKVAVKNPS